MNASMKKPTIEKVSSQNANVIKNSSTKSRSNNENKSPQKNGPTTANEAVQWVLITWNFINCNFENYWTFFPPLQKWLWSQERVESVRRRRLGWRYERRAGGQGRARRTRESIIRLRRCRIGRIKFQTRYRIRSTRPTRANYRHC